MTIRIQQIAYKHIKMASTWVAYVHPHNRCWPLFVIDDTNGTSD